MTHNIDELRRWLEVCFVVASIGTTLVPIIYAASPWYKSRLGRLFMLQATSFAVAMDLNIVFLFWTPANRPLFYLVNSLVFTIIAFATSALALMMWRLNVATQQASHPITWFLWKLKQLRPKDGQDDHS